MSSDTEQTAQPARTEPAAQAAHVHVHVIATREEYLEATAAIAAGTGPIAIDAERASGYQIGRAHV